MVDERPFEDVQYTPDGFSIPELKWRELLFVGALRRRGDHYVRDPTRPLPVFRDPDLFQEDCPFAARKEDDRIHVSRVHV